jgi:hypothetical protein
LVDQIRSSSVQQNINTNNNTEMIINKKSLQSEQQTSLLLKRTSDSLVTPTISDEQNRRRSSLSTELNTSDRSSRKGVNSTSTAINSNKDVPTTNGNSNEKVILIDTTAVSIIIKFSRDITDNPCLSKCM